MPKVTITIEDSPESEDGNVKLAMDFEPKLEKNAPVSPAQNLAFQMVSSAQKGFDVESAEVQ